MSKLVDKFSISIKIKMEGEKTKHLHLATIDNPELAKVQIQEIGKMLIALNETAEIEVEYSYYSEISGTWVWLYTYYANEQKLIGLPNG